MKIDRFKPSRKFTKAFAKLPARQRQRVEQSLKRATVDLTDPRLRVHELKGARAGTISLNAGGDLRILCRIYQEDGDVVALLQIVGTHSQLYG